MAERPPLMFSQSPDIQHVRKCRLEARNSYSLCLETAGYGSGPSYRKSKFQLSSRVAVPSSGLEAAAWQDS